MGAGSDTLQLSSGVHTLTTDNKLLNVETVKTHADGSTVDLTNQTESFNITVGAGTDSLKGGEAADTINILNAGEGNSDTIDGGAGSDKFNCQLDLML